MRGTALDLTPRPRTFGPAPLRRLFRPMKNLDLVVVLVLLCGGAPLTAAPERAEKNPSSVSVAIDGVVTRVELWTDRIVQVTHRPEAAKPGQSLAVIARPEPVAADVNTTAEGVLTMTTVALRVEVARATGRVRIMNRAGDVILAEPAGGTEVTPVTVGGFSTWRARQAFDLAPDEGIYGLGQHPDGHLDHRGTVVRLQQENGKVAVPVLVSSRGYGVLWDNPAVTDVDVGKTDPRILSWSSEAGDGVDYYVMAGPDLDTVVSDYRHLTGQVPMFPLWTWGFWQCRERYETQAQLLGVVDRYRQRGIPLDGIIQDWQYWKPGQWGSDDFDPARYPDPRAMVAAVHRAHAHIIISIWPRFDLGLKHTAELEKAHALYPAIYPNVYPKGEGRWYDPFNPEGRRLYWKFLDQNLFSLGIDGWWMDASEPELGGQWGQMREVKTAAGPGVVVYNAYPLEHAAGVYNGQRAVTSAKRVFILTRSGYAGSQRNAAVTWSGDTHGTWDVFRRQIPAGLDFSITGIPYWNTDIGGFFAGDPADPKYAELFTRWFQFGAFCPMFRVHGTGKPKEIWRFDAATQRILVEYDRLRYHLLPYIYSVSWQVTHHGYTMLRPLVMDFRTDPAVRNITDQLLFGPAIMANPVTSSGATSRRVYLPGATRWIDFWTGVGYGGGQTIDAAATLDRMPLFVRAGSIVPWGPDREYAAQNPDAPIELRIYPGADGEFTLYEDEGDNYDYEHGAYATIPLRWSETNRALTIGARQGDFPGMVRTQEFRVVFVSPHHGVGVPATATPDQTVQYNGEEVTVKRPQ